MRKQLLLAVLLLLTATTALAIPAKRVWRVVQQPDGTQLRLMLVGDERLHYFITEDSVPVLEADNGYYYADGIGFGMQRSQVLAHNEVQRKGNEIQIARTASVKRIEDLRPFTKQNLFRPTRPLEARRIVNDSTFITSDHRSITGKHKSIVILTEFPNRKFQANHDSTYYWDMVNEEGYTNEDGAIGSIHDYFKEQSHGLLDLTFDVVGPIEMDYNYSHYGGSSRDANDENPFEFAYEAIMKADSLYHPHWADYDWDGDGEVENMYLIYAGYGQATGGGSSTLWPAQTSFDEYNRYYPYYGYPRYDLNFNGTKINTFAYGNELYGGSSYYGPDRAQGMGTMTHEFSHCLGFPDLYNTDYSGATDMGNWSILASGSYGGPNGIGWVPTGYTAYEKWAAGWIDYKDFAFMNDTISALKSTRNGGDAYIIYNDRLRDAGSVDAQEYFLLENRTQSGWDTYLPAQGLEIMHVNYVRNVWQNNAVNTPTQGNGRSNMILVNANNNAQAESGNLWPYNGRDSIAAGTNPTLTFYNAQNDGTTAFDKSIVRIRWNRADSTVSFIYNPVDTMMTPAPTIEASPLEGTANSGSTMVFKDSTVVTLSAPLGYIRYSTDNKNWADYTEPFTIKDDSTTVYTYAWREGKDTSSVTTVLFVKQKKLAPPTISGDTLFLNSTRVTIRGTGGQLYYAQGANTRRFRTYRSPITITSTTVFRAYVRTTSAAYTNSDTVTVEFRRLEICAAPTIAVSADSSSITITSNESDGHIWYTTDTTTAFSEYTEPIDITTVDDSITVWAYVAADGKVISDTVSLTYVAPKKSTDAISRVTLGELQGRISVYTISGQPVATADRIDSISLRPGVYIVRDENGKVRKFTIR